MGKSAGVLVYRRREEIEFLLLKPGGPFYKNRSQGIWTIPKGEIQEGESALEAACREFQEETSFRLHSSTKYLGDFRLRKGKNVSVFIAEGDFDVNELVSKEFELVYPKDSGQLKSFSEIELGAWVTLEVAQSMLFPSQIPILLKAIDEISGKNNPKQ